MWNLTAIEEYFELTQKLLISDLSPIKQNLLRLFNQKNEACKDLSAITIFRVTKVLPSLLRFNNSFILMLLFGNKSDKSSILL